jgi:S1-C subfamily serine protease
MSNEWTDRFRRSFGATQAVEAFQRTRAIVGPANMPATQEGQLAQQALDLLENGQQPDARALAALELVIKMMRPSALTLKGALSALPPETALAFGGWNNFSDRVKPFLYSIGRIDSVPDQGVGTGFLIKPTVLVTNAHVLAFLSRDTNQLTKGQAVVRFVQEYGNFEPDPPVDILGVIAFDPDADIALLRISDPPAGSARQPLQIRSTDAAPGQIVVAIGYPFNDPQRNPMFINGIFGTKFGVKRAAPGEVVTSKVTDIGHDCSTLGGNSGSPVLAIEDATVVGLHKEGIFMFRNRALKGSFVKQFVDAHN